MKGLLLVLALITLGAAALAAPWCPYSNRHTCACEARLSDGTCVAWDCWYNAPECFETYGIGHWEVIVGPGGSCLDAATGAVAYDCFDHTSSESPNKPNHQVLDKPRAASLWGGVKQLYR